MAHDTNLPGRVPFYLVETAPNLGTEKNDLDALIASVEGVGVTPRLIIIDTLAQTLFGGEENSTGMVTFVANATALANHFKCLRYRRPPCAARRRQAVARPHQPARRR